MKNCLPFLLVAAMLTMVSTASAQKGSRSGKHGRSGRMQHGADDLGPLLPDPGHAVADNKRVTPENYDRIGIGDARIDVEEYLGAGFVTAESEAGNDYRIVVEYRRFDGRTGIEVAYVDDSVVGKAPWGMELIASGGREKKGARKERRGNRARSGAVTDTPFRTHEQGSVTFRMRIRSAVTISEQPLPLLPGSDLSIQQPDSVLPSAALQVSSRFERIDLPDNDSVTLEHYHRIDVGDSRQRIEEYLGAGSITSRYTEGGSQMLVVEYRRHNGKEGIEITFADGRVAGKSSWGLE